MEFNMMKITEKQCRKLNSETKEAVLDIRITLEYSIKLLEDYKSDLKIEITDLTKLIRKSKNKLKALEEKLK